MAAVAVLLSAGVAQADMSVSFDWGDIPLCTSGNPNRVGNPAFVLKGVPEGTTVLDFRLKDLDVPSYNHGGGKIKLAQSGNFSIPFGVFKYKSPCPPSGSHTYQWTVTAKAGNKKLATAKASRDYPK